jgi:acetate kinase
MGGIDAFTGGIGENSTQIRAGVTDDMEWLGLTNLQGRAGFSLPSVQAIVAA